MNNSKFQRFFMYASVIGLGLRFVFKLLALIKYEQGKLEQADILNLWSRKPQA